MKKFMTLTAMIAALTLSGCSTMGTTTGGQVGANDTIGTATTLGMNIFKNSVDSRCRSELEKQNIWRIARTAMTVEEEASMQAKICGCVSEQAPQQVTVVDMTNAAIDSEYRAKLVTNVVTKSLQTCYANAIK